MTKEFKYIHILSFNDPLQNIDCLVGEPEDPKIPEPVDIIFSCTVYHHIDNRVEYLKGLKKYLKQHGKIAVVDAIKMENNSSKLQENTLILINSGTTAIYVH